MLHKSLSFREINEAFWGDMAQAHDLLNCGFRGKQLSTMLIQGRESRQMAEAPNEKELQKQERPHGLEGVPQEGQLARCWRVGRISVAEGMGHGWAGMEVSGSKGEKRECRKQLRDP